MIGVYKIVNTITGDYYIGSSKDLERRWREHRKPSVWNKEHKQLYVDMQKYGVDKFAMEVIEEVMIDKLHSREQYWIEQLQPVYNKNAAYTGIDTNDIQKYKKQYHSQHADEARQYRKQYYRQHADEEKQHNQQYYSQQCNYNDEILTLDALRTRFRRQCIEHPTLEAKKYLICQK